METAEFRSKIKPDTGLSIDGRDFVVKEVVRFRLNEGFWIYVYSSRLSWRDLWWGNFQKGG